MVVDVEHKSGLAQELRKEREEGRGLGRGDDYSKAGDEIILSTSMIVKGWHECAKVPTDIIIYIIICGQF